MREVWKQAVNVTREKQWIMMSKRTCEHIRLKSKEVTINDQFCWNQASKDSGLGEMEITGDPDMVNLKVWVKLFRTRERWRNEDRKYTQLLLILLEL